MARTTLTTGSSDADSTSYPTTSFTPTAGRLLVAFVMSGGQPFQGNTVAPNAIGAPGLTLSSLVETKHPVADLQLTCFRGWVTGPVGNHPLTFDFGTQVQRWCAWTVYEVDDIDATANGTQAVAWAVPNAATLTSHLDTGQAPAGWLSVAAIALDQHVVGIAPGVGSAHLDDLQTNAPLANGQLDTLQRAADGQLPSVQWQWAGLANAVSITVSFNPAPPDDGPIIIVEDLTPVEKLVRQYEPILFLDPAEQFVPVDAKRYLEHCRLWSTVPAMVPDEREHWGLAYNSKFPRHPWTEAGDIVGRPDENGAFIGAQVNRLFSKGGGEFCLELGGWRDLAGVHTAAVDTNTVNTYADGAQVAGLYAQVPELDASKFWYHAEVFDAARLRQLLGTVAEPGLLSILVQMHNPTLLCYYMFFPFHDQHGQDQGCEGSVRDQLVGSCGGDWACYAVLLEQPDGSANPEPAYIGLTGEQIWLKDRSPIPLLAHHFDDDNRINLNVMKWSDATVATDSGHPRIHVAPGSHALATTAGAITGYAFEFFTRPVLCSEFDSESVIPDLTPSELETAAMLIAKLGFGPIGWVYAAIEFELAREAADGPVTYPLPHLRDTDYPAAGAGLTIKPKDVNVPDAGAKTADWRSRNGLVVNNKRYDSIVDRTQQQFWPPEPNNGSALQPQGWFSGRWGPRVETDPLSRRVGQHFPDFWKMFFLAIADGQANDTLLG
jgi:hypothetical protein